MKGLQVFNVGAGFWDVGSVRTTYPNLLPPPLGKNSLAGKVRLQRLLIGTEVGLTITVSDTGTYNSIYSFIQDAKTNVAAGGGFSIFGIRFGAGGGKTTITHREVKDVSFVTLQEGGQVIIAPSPKVCASSPVVLNNLLTRLGCSGSTWSIGKSTLGCVTVSRGNVGGYVSLRRGGRRSRFPSGVKLDYS
jgi:hypothetical protein